MADELLLYVSSTIKIEVEIDACGLKVLVPQAILDICEGLSLIKQIHGA